MRFLLSLSIAVLAVGCAHGALHLRDTPADYAQLGLGESVAVAEDGRRTQPGTDEYEWWYLDGVAKDGTVVVVVFSDNWLPGERTRNVTIDVTPPGKPTRSAALRSQEPGSFARDRAGVHIGGNRFEGDLDHYSITVDPKELDGVGCHLELERRVASFRPGTGVIASDDDFFAWVVAVPDGALSGTLTIDGETVAFSGSGYHDHNWGNVPPWALMRNWWWGRGAVGDRTVVTAELRPAKGRGEKPIALLYYAGPDGVIEKAHGAAAQLVEGPAAPNEDPTHVQRQPSHVTIETVTGVSAQLERRGAPITSTDLLAVQPGLVRFLAKLSGRAPWYSRWTSAVTVDVKGAKSQGAGTVEFMDFE